MFWHTLWFQANCSASSSSVVNTLQLSRLQVYFGQRVRVLLLFYYFSSLSLLFLRKAMAGSSIFSCRDWITTWCSSYVTRWFLCRSCICRRSNQPWQRCSRTYLRHPIYCLRSVAVSANAPCKKCSICSAALPRLLRSCRVVRNDIMYFATQFHTQILHYFFSNNLLVFDVSVRILW